MEQKTFAELGLSAKVAAAVEAAGYITPTPIQVQAIPVALTGQDILGIAQTGTGKTAAFTMPMICRLETGRARARMPRSLILAPTRELAAQVAQSFEKYGVNHKLSVALLIGGVAMDAQIAKLDRGVDVLIATPGRLLDHFSRGRIMLMGVEILVIDEADRMLDMGFIPDIEKICKLLPPRRQTLFFSATMPPEITRLSEQFLTDPVRIEVAKPATTAKTITQRYFFLRGHEDWEKREALRELIRNQNVKNAIIFCNRKRDVAILHKSLSKHGFNAGALHGDMDQTSRMATLDKFRAGEIMLLAASDVAARGLDIPEVSHVFNFDVPWHADDYVHRIGRTGRAGREGFAATIVTPDDIAALQAIEKITGEAAVWLNEAPSEEELADGGRRKRGRIGRGGRSASRSGSRNSRPERSGRARRPEDRAPQDEAVSSGGVAADGKQRERSRGGRRPSRRDDQPAMAAEQPARAAPPRADETLRESHKSSERRGRPQARTEREPRDRSRSEIPRAPRSDRPDAPQQPQRPITSTSQPQRASSVGRRPEPSRQPATASAAFDDNIPAFLRRPVRAG